MMKLQQDGATAHSAGETKEAEIYAILACGMEILKTAPKRRTIQICTDSQAALMAIESNKVKSQLVLDCKKILNDLASCNRVILTWVPGHSGVPENEEADRLARRMLRVFTSGKYAPSDLRSDMRSAYLGGYSWNVGAQWARQAA
ncbi:hypothetical protein NQ318_004128 [Aromia moschata]|uniref:RNase H type-1 domain-containing protein n=1 Tax=Aromia moschata TaxID=1265417 RepID=A0AAV8YPW7_9CUCU|nr:hypothetical protein NQ318_004128 [Aromia moschata]